MLPSKKKGFPVSFALKGIPFLFYKMTNMDSVKLDQTFWNNTYKTDSTPWDIGHISPPIKNFVDSLPDRNLSILIPGGGKSHEAVYLHENGFSNVHVCDWAALAFESLKMKCPNFPEEHIIIGDFFNIEGQYDLILEQTFFCALLPSQRANYVNKVADLLKEGGMLAGLLFASHFETPGPPFGGTKNEYLALFGKLYDILVMETAQNSILPRMGNELFFKMKKK